MSNIKFCVACGSHNIVHFIGREMQIGCNHFVKTVTHLTGVECKEANCGEVQFLGNSAERYSQAGDECVKAFQAESEERFRQALEVMGIKRGDTASFDALKQAMMSSDLAVIEAAVYVLDLMMNNGITFSHSIRAYRQYLSDLDPV